MSTHHDFPEIPELQPRNHLTRYAAKRELERRRTVRAQDDVDLSDLLLVVVAAVVLAVLVILGRDELGADDVSAAMVEERAALIEAHRAAQR